MAELKGKAPPTPKAPPTDSAMAVRLAIAETKVEAAAAFMAMLLAQQAGQAPLATPGGPATPGSSSSSSTPMPSTFLNFFANSS